MHLKINQFNQKNIYYQKAQNKYKYKNKEIDFLISINVLHSLKIYDLESFRNKQGFKNLIYCSREL